MYVRCTRTRAAYGWYARDVKSRADCSVIPSNSSRFKSCFAICSEHKYSEYFQKTHQNNLRRWGERARRVQGFF